MQGLITDAETARETMRNGMLGLASRDQVYAAKSVVDCLTALDKQARLDAGGPTEITEQRDARPDGELFDELHAALRDPVLQAEFARRSKAGQ